MEIKTPSGTIEVGDLIASEEGIHSEIYLGAEGWAYLHVFHLPSGGTKIFTSDDPLELLLNVVENRERLPFLVPNDLLGKLYSTLFDEVYG